MMATMQNTPETRAIPTDTLDLSIPWRVRVLEPNREILMCKPHADTHGDAVFPRTEAGVEHFGCDDASDGGDGAVRASDEWVECPLSAINGWIFAWMVQAILMADFAGATGHIVLAFVNVGMLVLFCGLIFWEHARLVKLRADLEVSP